MTSQDSLAPKGTLHLSLEVSTPEGSLALFRGDQLLWDHTWSRGASHSEMLTETLERALAETATSLADLHFVAVTRGPGSFTGLRVGINLAKTLGLSLNLPLVAPTSLEVLAASARKELPVGSKLLAGLNAFKGMIYWSLFEKTPTSWAFLTEPVASTWSDVAASLTEPVYHFLGDGYLPFKESLPEEISSRLDLSHGESTSPSARVLGPWAWSAFTRGQTFTWKSLSPLYIRRSEAEEKRSKENS